jgi:signal transduction histidine kinase
MRRRPMEQRENLGAETSPGAPTPLENAAAVGELACGVVHDLANIMQSLLLRAELVLSSEGLAPSHAKNLDQIIADARDIAEVVRSLLERGRAATDAMPPSDLAAVATEAFGTAGADRVRFEGGPSPLPVHCDPVELGRGLTLLAALLLRGAPDRTTLRAGVSRAMEDEAAPSWLRSGDWAEVRLTRDGPGPEVPLEENVSLIRKGIAALNADVVRVRGIVKIHRGVARVSESVGDDVQRLEIVLAFPLAS